MRGRILNKIIAFLIILVPLFTVTDCRKQEKCGCDGDVLGSLEGAQASVSFNEAGTNITFQLLDNPYSSYIFCNPTEMFSKFEDINPGDVVLISGNIFWDCNFLYQSSNYSYYSSPYKVYQVQVTNVISDLYGK
jgi:hypothetical protein